MRSFRVSIDHQNCQPCQVTLSGESVIKAPGQTAKDRSIIELNSVQHILFNLINDRADDRVGTVMPQDSCKQIILSTKMPDQSTTRNSRSSSYIIQGGSRNPRLSENANSSFENS